MSPDVHRFLARVARAHAAGRRLDLAAILAASEQIGGHLWNRQQDDDPEMDHLLAEAERRSAAR
jgi:hypothetical protein